MDIDKQNTNEHQHETSGSESRSGDLMIRSEQAQEIISRRPGFVEKWAIAIFFGILITMLAATWFVRYPDIVTVQAILTAENGREAITAKNNGILKKLMVRDGQAVKQREIIAILDNEVSYTHVIALSNNIERCFSLLATNKTNDIVSLLTMPSPFQGRSQLQYQQLLFSAKLLANTKMSDDKSIEQKLLFQQKLQQMQKDLDRWLYLNVIKATKTGTFRSSGLVQPNGFVRPGIIVGYVVPQNESYYVETILPQNSLGKVHVGANVQLRFEAYPYEEWGAVNGHISFIATNIAGTGLPAVVKLNNGLITNNNKQLTFHDGLKAQAIIITKDMRLLERFYYGFVRSTSLEK